MNTEVFYVTVPAGIERLLPAVFSTLALPAFEVLRTGSGYAELRSASGGEVLCDTGIFNNVFKVIKAWPSGKSGFASLVDKLERTIPDLNTGPEDQGRTFRVRYSLANQFSSVDRQLMARAERCISSSSGLVPDRLNPDVEFWFLIRSEGPAWFLRLVKPSQKIVQPAAGELKAGMAKLLCAAAGAAFRAGQSFAEHIRLACDPFAGSGAIPAALYSLYPEARILAGDLDPEKVETMRLRFANTPLEIVSSDACRLEVLNDASVDLIVTDPPWGQWDADLWKDGGRLEDLYKDMLTEFSRILASSGVAVVLTGAKKEFEDAFALQKELKAVEPLRTDLLVNGKKAALYVFRRFT